MGQIMNSLFKLMGAGVLVAGASVYGMQAEGKVREDYNIQAPSEVDFMDRCQRSMDMNDVAFNDGASRTKGCACLTKTLVSTAKPGQLDAVETYMAFMMESGGDNARDELNMFSFENSLNEINKRHKLNDMQSLEIFTMVGEAIGTCGDQSFHTVENVSRLASLAPRRGKITLPARQPKTSSGMNDSFKPVIKPKPSAANKTPEAPKLRGMSKG